MGSIGVVYDTNTIISAYGFGGKPEAAIEIGVRDEVAVYVSEETLEELTRVLQYERLEFTETEQEEIPPEFCELTDAEVLSPTVDLNVVEDDPEDDKFVELAVEADAEYIVSGDRHLKALGEFDGIDVRPPAEFIDVAPFASPDSDLRPGE